MFLLCLLGLEPPAALDGGEDGQHLIHRTVMEAVVAPTLALDGVERLICPVEEPRKGAVSRVAPGDTQS